MSLPLLNLQFGSGLQDLELSPLRVGEPATRLVGETSLCGIPFIADAIVVRRVGPGVQRAEDPRDDEDLGLFLAAAGSRGGFETLSLPGYGNRRYVLFFFPCDA